MDAEKKVLIITDGTEPIIKAAQSIAGAITGCSVSIRSSEAFQGTDLLPAEVFFIGCETVKPASFNQLSQLLAHINLSGRRCGVFSNNKNALDYLCGMVKSCGAKLGEPVFLGENSDGAIKNLVKEVVNCF